VVGKIFLNYRRVDADAWADRLYERLTKQLPTAEIFMDIDGDIPLGLPWAQWLDSQVAACDLMLVLIGRSWVAEFEARSAPGERDFVRVEIESALARRIPVVPIFLGDAPAPKSASLPSAIRPLLDLQAIRLQRLSFDADAKALIDGVVRSIKLARGEAVEPARPGRAPVTPIDRAAEGRIKVDAKIVLGAPGGWLNPGAGKAEWFKDLDAGPEMVVVPAGEFMMGSPSSEERWAGYDGREEPQHKVTIAAPLAVGRFAVTFDEWDAAVATGGVTHKPGDQGWGRGRRPVVNVSWEDAKAYCAWLSKATGKTYRLLSEAEWEYCCRARTPTPFWWGSDISAAQANFDGNYTYGSGKKGDYRKQTVPVDTFEPNPWGLYQVHGNVWEWCEDVWHANYNGALLDGSVWRQGGDQSRRVVRGGSWGNVPQFLRSAGRNGFTTGNRSNSLGFRVGRTLTP
jgi:formylglycine-generating enzyme required for sulfatase activity